MPHPRSQVHASQGPHNSLQYAFRDTSRWRVAWNLLWMSLARYAPWFGFKNFLMRRTGAGIGKNVSLAFGVQLDILFPGDIIIEDDAIIGYNTTILCHGYLHDSYQRGPVLIGERASIGANSTILPGVTIGDDAVVGAMSLVREDVPPGEFWAGVPAKRIRNRY